MTAPLFSSLQPQLRESVLQWVPKTRVSAPPPSPPSPDVPNPHHQWPGTDSFYRSAPIKSFIMDTPSLYTPGLICMRKALPGEFFCESLSSAFPREASGPGGGGWGRTAGHKETENMSITGQKALLDISHFVVLITACEEQLGV